MVIPIGTVVGLLLACGGIILAIKLAKLTWRHRAIRIMVFVPLVIIAATGGKMLLSGGPGSHRFGLQVWDEPSNPKRAIQKAAATVRDFAHDRFEEGRTAALVATDLLKEKVEEHRHAKAVQEHAVTLSTGVAEASDTDGAGVTTMIQSYSTQAREMNWRIVSGSALWSLIAAVAIGAFLYLSYILLDASTRGHFSWPLRFAAIGGFGVIYVALSVLRH